MKLREYIEKIKRGAANLPEDLDSFLDSFVPDVLMKSETLQEAYGVEERAMEEAYAKAYSLYERSDFGEAAVIFRWLVVLNPFVYKFWMGLGASWQMLEMLEKALHAYAMAALLDCEHPHPHFYAYRCYTKLGNEKDATKALRLAHRRTKEKPQYAGLRGEIERLCSRQELQI